MTEGVSISFIFWELSYVIYNGFQKPCNNWAQDVAQ